MGFDHRALAIGFVFGVRLASAATPAPATPAAATSCRNPGADAKAAVFWEAMTCYHKARDLKSAAAVGERLIAKDPTQLRAYFLVSWFYYSQGSREVGAAENDLQTRALALLDRAIEAHPTAWDARQERGDYYFLRQKQLDRAYADYVAARGLYANATVGHKAGLENRIARVAEKLKRNGEAVEASCLALYFDPDDAGALERINRLQGSCLRKNVKDPRNTEAGAPPTGETPAH